MNRNISLLLCAVSLNLSGCARHPSADDVLVFEQDPTWPTTCEAALNRLDQEVTNKNQNYIKGLGEDELIGLHFGLGMAIRNEMGLWQGNFALGQDCLGDSRPSGGEYPHPDDVSGEIIERYWLRLNNR